MLRITEQVTVQEIAADFEELWELSQAVGVDEVNEMLSNRNEKEAKFKSATLTKNARAEAKKEQQWQEWLHGQGNEERSVSLNQRGMGSARRDGSVPDRRTQSARERR